MRKHLPVLLLILGFGLACLSFPQAASQQAQTPGNAEQEVHQAILQLSKHRDSVQAMTEVGWLLAASGQLDSGARWLKRAIQQDPQVTLRVSSSMRPEVLKQAREAALEAWQDSRNTLGLWLLAELGAGEDQPAYGALWQLLSNQGSADDGWLRRIELIAQRDGKDLALSLVLQVWGRERHRHAAGAALALSMSLGDLEASRAYLEQALALKGGRSIGFLPQPESPLWDIRALREWQITKQMAKADALDLPDAILEMLRLAVGGDMDNAWKRKLDLETDEAFKQVPEEGRRHLLYDFARMHEFWRKRAEAGSEDLVPKDANLETVYELLNNDEVAKAAEVLAELVQAGAAGLATDLARLRVMALLAKNPDRAGEKAIEGLASGIRSVISVPTLESLWSIFAEHLDADDRELLQRRVHASQLAAADKALVLLVLEVNASNQVMQESLDDLLQAGETPEDVRRLQELSKRPPEPTPEELLTLGDQALQAGDANAALVAYKKAALASEDFARVARALLAAHLACGNGDEASSALIQVLDGARKSKTSRKLGVRDALKPGNLDQVALAKLKRWAHTRPVDESAWLLLALVYDDYGMRDEAKAAAEAYRKITRNPRIEVAGL